MNNDPLWQDIRDEATQAAQQEPVLASYLEHTILSHADLESALAYMLADSFGNNSVSAQEIRQLFAPILAGDVAVKMRQDLLAYYDRDPACDKYSMPLLYFKGFHALQIYRIAHHLWNSDQHSLALYLQNQSSERFAVDVHPAARIGGGIMIDHATGLVIGETAIVGDNVSMLHGVTLGGTGCGIGARHPSIGNGVLIAAGAKILGNIEIGEGVKIGAGSLVLESVAPHTTVAGVPAKPVGVPKDPSPALSMDQRLGNGS